MATIITSAGITDHRAFQVVHPLDDVAEEKRSPAGLGQMHMTPSVKLSLYALQGYLLLIGLTVGYRVLTLAGIFGHHVH